MSRSSKKTARTAAARPPAVLMKTAVTDAESERRLRPVYEALFAKKAKQALKLSNQAIQKRPGWPAARALRACALLQLGQRNDALDAVQGIRADIDAHRVPVDEDAAVKLAMFYRDARCEHLAGEVYEQAWQADPASVRLADSAFGHYVRARCFSAAQKVALRLQRVLPRKASHYALWIAAATWLELQLLKTAADAPDPRILTLAAKRVSKALADNSLPSAEVVRFAVRLYVDAGEFDTARDLLARPRILMGRAEMHRLRALVEKRAGCREEAAKLYCDIVSHMDPDDWNCWAQYFTLIDLDKGGAEETWALVDKVCEIGDGSKYRLRGPFLAKLELLLRLRKFDQLRAGIVEYFGKFSKKLVCAADLRPYVDFLVREGEDKSLFKELEAIEGQEAAARISLSWLRLWFGQLDMSVAWLVEQYTALVDADLDPTERQVGDDFLLMAVHKLLPCVEGEWRYADPCAVLQSLMIIEHGLSKSPHNHHFKLLLIVLYTEIKYTERAFAIWSSLGVKHIQLATLTHLVLEPLFAALNYIDLADLFKHVQTLWRECDKDIPEGISRAFQAGSINAAADFLLFRRRVERTAVLAQCMHVETLALLGRGDDVGIMGAWQVIGEAPRFTCSSDEMRAGLVLNRDEKCLDFWHLSDYKPDTRLEDEDDPVVELGEFLPKIQQDSLFAEIRATTNILAMAKGVETPIAGDEQKVVVTRANGKTFVDGPLQYYLHRVEFVAMLSACLQGLRRILQGGAAGEAGLDEIEKQVPFLTTYLSDTSGELKAKLGACATPNDYSSRFPPILHDCCLFVGHALQITALGLLSMSPLMAQKKKQSRKGGKPVANGRAKPVLAKGVEKIVNELKKATIIACANISEAIHGVICFQWGKHLIEEKCFDSLLSYLPEELRLQFYEHDVATSRTDSAQHLLKLIANSHLQAATRVTAAVDSISQKLKLSHP